MFRLVVDIHLSDIGCPYWERLQQHAPCCILRMSINGVSSIFSFASWVIYVLIGWRHPFIKYCLPLLARTTATCSLPHPGNERQRRVNSFSSCIFVHQGIAQIIAYITDLPTTLTGKSTIYQRYNSDSKSIDIASCKACTNILLIVEYTISIRYY